MKKPFEGWDSPHDNGWCIRHRMIFNWFPVYSEKNIISVRFYNQFCLNSEEKYRHESRMEESKKNNEGLKMI